MATRRVSGTIPQGVDEAIKYPLDFAVHVTIHGAVESATCTLYNQKKGIYENDLLSGLVDISGSVVTSKTVSELENRTMYLLSVAAVFEDGNTLSGVVPIMGEV